MGKGYGIAAGHRLTAEAGSEVLEAGGTAADAAVAGALMAMVAEPVLAGLMGGGFAMIRPDDGAAELMDAFVSTPGVKRPMDEIDFRAIEADFGTATQEFHIGAGAIAAAGLARGLWELHARHGRMPFAALAEPAARAARSGVEITPFQARLGEIVAPILAAGPAARALYCADGAPLGAGAVFRNPELADVMEEFAREGPRFVQEGEVAGAVLSLAEAGGHLGAADLSGYRVAWRRPALARRGGAEIALNPPPSLGGTLIAFSLALLGPEPGAAEIARAFEATAAGRSAAGLDRDAHAGAAALAEPGLVARYRAEIATLAARPAARRGTTHISVIDAKGLGVALTLSNGEGCGLIAPGTGIMPNNMLGEADLLPDGFEAWVPGQRLASMMAPLVADLGEGRRAVIGSGGSNRIRTALAQVLLRLVDQGERLDAAIGAPRLHVEGAGPAVVDFEAAGLAEGARAALLEAYPQARPWPERSMFYGGVHGVMRGPGGDIEAAGDPRRGGAAIIG